MNSFERDADLLQHFCDCCTRLRAALPLLRRFERVVGSLGAGGI